MDQKIVLPLAVLAMASFKVVSAQAATLGYFEAYCLSQSGAKKELAPSAAVNLSCQAAGFPKLTGSVSYDLGAGTATAVANLPQNNNNGAGIGSDSSSGDVLTLEIPGASPTTVTSIPISATLNGYIKTNGTSGSNNFVLVSYDADAASEGYVPNGQFIASNILKLPPAKNSSADLLFWVVYNSGVYSNQTLAGAIQVTGASAVIPLFVYVGAFPDQNQGQLEDVSLSVSFSAQLPPGVVCHSRSGKALGGVCGP